MPLTLQAGHRQCILSETLLVNNHPICFNFETLSLASKWLSGAAGWYKHCTWRGFQSLQQAHQICAQAGPSKQSLQKPAVDS